MDANNISITINLTVAETNALVKLLDAAVKGSGLAVANDAAVLHARIMSGVNDYNALIATLNKPKAPDSNTHESS